MNPTLESDVLANAIHEAILTADIHQLLYLEHRKIPHCKGILDETRQELVRAVEKRRAELVAPQFKPRW